jgi:hypothetical protein
MTSSWDFSRRLGQDFGGEIRERPVLCNRRSLDLGFSCRRQAKLDAGITVWNGSHLVLQAKIMIPYCTANCHTKLSETRWILTTRSIAYAQKRQETLLFDLQPPIG